MIKLTKLDKARTIAMALYNLETQPSPEGNPAVFRHAQRIASRRSAGEVESLYQKALKAMQEDTEATDPAPGVGIGQSQIARAAERAERQIAKYGEQPTEEPSDDSGTWGDPTEDDCLCADETPERPMIGSMTPEEAYAAGMKAALAPETKEPGMPDELTEELREACLQAARGIAIIDAAGYHISDCSAHAGGDSRVDVELEDLRGSGGFERKWYTVSK